MADAWTWGISRDEEYWPEWSLPTREAAIAEGTSYFGGDPFYVAKCRRKPFDPSVVRVDRILEWAEEQAADEGAIYEDETIECTPGQERELEAALTAALRAWWGKHGIGKCFRGLEMAEIERIETAPGHTDLMISPEAIDEVIANAPAEEGSDVG